MIRIILLNMKSLIKVIILFTFLSLFFTVVESSAQVIDLGAEQSFAISGITSLQFSTTSNNILKHNFTTNPNLTIDVTSFFGSPIKATALADLVSLNSSVEINKSGTYNLSYASANPNTSTYGLSILPLFGPIAFTLKTTSTSTPPPTTSSSSSSGGTSLTPTPTPGTSTTPEPTPNEGSGGEIAQISGPNTLNLKPNTSNTLKLTISLSGFKLSSICQIYTSNDNLVIVKPRKFIQEKNNSKQTITVTIPREFASNLIETNTSKNVRVNVTCENGASDEVTLSIVP